jgi:hypothetical protein
VHHRPQTAAVRCSALVIWMLSIEERKKKQL